MKKMIMKIRPDGGMELTVEGVAGPACKEFVDPIIAGLGVAEEVTPTDEMYASCPLPEATQEG